jgi:hypothetical protein
VLFGKLEGRVVFLIATVGLLAVHGFGIPGLFSPILTVLYFVLYGYLVERGSIPREWWPFQRQLNLQDLAISAAFLVAALASAMGVLLLRANHAGMLVSGLLMGVFCSAGLVFFLKGVLYGPRRS